MSKYPIIFLRVKASSVTDDPCREIANEFDSAFGSRF